MTAGCSQGSAVDSRDAAQMQDVARRSLSRSDSLGTSVAASIDTSNQLTLSNIRQSLIRQEETIIFNIIERAQFKRNSVIYQPGAIPVPAYAQDGRQLSFMEWLLLETEQVHGKIRRYTSPDEHPYFPEYQPPLVLPPINYPQEIHQAGKGVNINRRILAEYLEELLPGIAAEGDDANYGSAAMHDVLLLQALSKRIHYGKFVADAKFRADTARYSDLITTKDAAGIMEALTDIKVEDQVVERVRAKAAVYGQDEISLGADSKSHAHYKVRPEKVAELYRDWVMPLTKEVQVQYLLNRLS